MIGKILVGIGLVILVLFATGAVAVMNESRLCGDGRCSDWETDICPVDCKQSCGDNVCTGAEVVTCPTDCVAPPYCGDGNCDFNENHNSCLKDCDMPYWCGDGYCADDETVYTCPQDCGQPPYCGDNSCDFNEDSYNCPQDCPTVCVDDCYTVGELRCNGLRVEKCFQLSTGCNRWIFERICEVDCQDGQCVTSPEPPAPPPPEPHWFTIYNEQRQNEVNDYYIQARWLYDFNNPIGNNAKTLFDESNSLKDFVKKVAVYVYDNVAYDYDGWEECKNDLLPTCELGADCMTKSASQILLDGFGVCSTQSRVVIAMLRSQGIAARYAHGCVCENYGNEYCGALFKIGQVPPVFKYENIYDERGYAITAGGSHGWVEVWMPEYGWTIIESTNGYAYNILCYRYMRLGAPLDTDTVELCYTTDMYFDAQCALC